MALNNHSEPSEIPGNTSDTIPQRPGETAGEQTLECTIANIERLARTGATDDEIATQLGLSVARLQRKFSKSLAKARATLKLRLRARQTALALRDDGSERMLLWLGRQYLGQSESTGRNGTAEESSALIKQYVNIRVDDV